MTATDPGSLAAVARWLFGQRHPAAVEQKTRLLLLDTLGCMLAGLAAPPVAGLARSLGAADGGPIRMPVVDAALSPGSAASVLATAACWDEACEGLARAHGRPGVPVIAAGLALGVQRDATLGRLLDAIVAGYEVGGRMGERLRIRPGMHVDAGWPALGVAAAAALLLDARADGAINAVEIAAAQIPFGLYLPVEQGADGRNTFLGHAAWLGTYAAFAAEAGIAAPRGAVERYAALALGIDILPAMAPAGEYIILESYLKPFAAVRHVHYGAQAALDLRERAQIEPRSITAIELDVYPEAHTYCANRAPATPIQAQFSLTFGVAAALRFGTLGPEVYREPLFEDKELRRLEALIAIRADAALGAGGRRGAKLAIHCRGERLTQSVTQVPGDPGLPFSDEQCREKFLRNTRLTLGAARAEATCEAILRAEARTPLRPLWESLGSS